MTRIALLNNETQGVWTTKSISFSATLKGAFSFKIGFVVNGVSNATFVALRSVALQHGPCAGDNRTVTPAAEVSFHCHETGHYIPKYRVCDGVQDCPVAEDEEEAICGEH